MSRTKLNTTGSKSKDIVELPNGEKAERFWSYGTVVAYKLFKSNKAVICKGPYSATTSKHLSDYRSLFNVDKEDTFEYRAFLKRAELDCVNVLTGWN